MTLRDLQKASSDIRSSAVRKYVQNEIRTWTSDIQAPLHNCPACCKDHPCVFWPQRECGGIWCYCPGGKCGPF